MYSYKYKGKTTHLYLSNEVRESERYHLYYNAKFMGILFSTLEEVENMVRILNTHPLTD